MYVKVLDTWAFDSFGFDTSCAILSILAGNAIISILADQKYSHLPKKWLCMLAGIDSINGFSRYQSSLVSASSIGSI